MTENAQQLPQPFASKPRLALGALLLALPTAVFAALGSQSCPAPQLRIAPPAEPSANTQLTADKAQSLNQGIQAEGNVRIEKNDQALEAPEVFYDPSTGLVKLNQGGTLVQSDLAMTIGSKGDMYLDDFAGQLNDVHYLFNLNGGRGMASQVHLSDEEHAELKHATYTTCAGDNPDWYLSGSTVRLNKDTGRGEAFNTVLRFYKVPIFYSPYFNFPIDDQRHTGFLYPVFEHNSTVGYSYSFPFYINLAPNYDATISPNYLSRRGWKYDGEFRYLSAHHQGQLGGTIMPSDRRYGHEQRDFFEFKHKGKLAPHLGVEAKYANASDYDYFDDLTSSLSTTSSNRLTRNVALNYEIPGVELTALVEDYQRLYDVRPTSNYLSNPDTYSRLPQINLNLRSPTAPFSIGLDNEFVIFNSDGGVNTERTDVRPHLNFDLDYGGWYVNAELAHQYTRYRFKDDNTKNGNAPEGTVTRDLPSFSAVTGLRFTRQLNNGMRQTLEPQVGYAYRSYKDQDDLPLFDTGIPNLYYDRIFTADRFIGKDRVADANQATAGVRSRLLSAEDGRTVLDLSLARMHAFSDQRVGWWKQGITTGYVESGSDYVAEAQFSPTENWHMGVSTQYNPDDDKFERALAQIGFQNSAGFRLNLSWHRYQNYRLRQQNRKDGTLKVSGDAESLQQTVVDLAAPITDNIDFVGRWNYSLENNRTVEFLAGLEFRPSCCWAGRVSWRDYIAHRPEKDEDFGRRDKAIMLQIIFTGLASVGQSSESLLGDDSFSDQPSDFDY